MGVRFVPSSFFSYQIKQLKTDDVDDDDTRKIHRLQTIIQA